MLSPILKKKAKMVSCERTDMDINLYPEDGNFAELERTQEKEIDDMTQALKNSMPVFLGMIIMAITSGIAFRVISYLIGV